MDKRNLVILSVAILGACTTFLAYNSAKDSYKAVGINDGKTMQKEEFIKELNKIKQIQKCDPANPNLVSVVSVKSTNLYSIKTDGDSFQFCLME